MIRILVADDHPLVRSGLEDLIGIDDEMELVASASDGVEAVALACATQPDVVVMDVAMPYLDGIQATREITSLVPGARVVVLTCVTDRAAMREAVAAGAVDYVVKDATPRELVDAIRRAASAVARAH